MSHVHAFYMFLLFNIFWYIWTAWDFSDCLFLPLSLSLLFTLMRQWHQNISLLHLGTLFVLGHLRFLILPLFLFGFVMRMPERTSKRTSLDKAFIRNAESSCQISPTLTYPLSFIIGVGSHCVTSRSPVLSCWSRSSTPTCMNWMLLYLFFVLTFELRT